MAKDLKPNLCQLNLWLFTEAPVNLPLQKTAELHAALGDLLLNALTAASETPMEVDDDESEAHY
jgi:hypothetical protein